MLVVMFVMWVCVCWLWRWRLWYVRRLNWWQHTSIATSNVSLVYSRPICVTRTNKRSGWMTCCCWCRKLWFVGSLGLMRIVLLTVATYDTMMLHLTRSKVSKPTTCHRFNHETAVSHTHPHVPHNIRHDAGIHICSIRVVDTRNRTRKHAHT